MHRVVQVRFCGFGGQGVLLMGALLGRAAVLQGLWAAGSSSYGAQARGSACRADVVMAPGPLDYPHLIEADLLVALASEAYDRHLCVLKPRGTVVYDAHAVQPRPGDPRPHVPVPASRAALEHLGSSQPANVILLAAAVAHVRLVDTDALVRALEATVDPAHLETNRRALELGLALGERSRTARSGGHGP